MEEGLSLNELYDLKQRVKKRIREEEQKIFEQSLNHQKEKTLAKWTECAKRRDSVEDAYSKDLSFHDKWIKNENALVSGCNAEECWYTNNKDRIEEFNGIYVKVIDPSVAFCDVCIEDASDDDIPQEYFDMILPCSEEE